MTFISKYFTLEEATTSDTAARLGIPNLPNPAQLEAIRFTASKLDIIREVLGPIIITSWLRIPELNRAIPGSSSTSAHQYGYAVDCKVAGMSAHDLCNKIFTLCSTHNRNMGLPFDQIIHEYGQWAHFSLDPKARKQRLTIFAGAGGYKQGILMKSEYFNT